MNVKFMNPSLSSWMEGTGNQAEGFRSIIRRTGGFPGGLVVKNPSADAGDVKRLGFGPWFIKIPWSLFLCMVLESVLVSFFYMWLTNFPNTTC